MVVSSPVGPMRLSIDGGWPQWSRIEKMSGTMTNGKPNSTERVLDSLIADAASDLMDDMRLFSKGDVLSLGFENASAFHNRECTSHAQHRLVEWPIAQHASERAADPSISKRWGSDRC